MTSEPSEVGSNLKIVFQKDKTSTMSLSIVWDLWSQTPSPPGFIFGPPCQSSTIVQEHGVTPTSSLVLSSPKLLSSQNLSYSTLYYPISLNFPTTPPNYKNTPSYSTLNYPTTPPNYTNTHPSYSTSTLYPTSLNFPTPNYTNTWEHSVSPTSPSYSTPNYSALPSYTSTLNYSPPLNHSTSWNNSNSSAQMFRGLEATAVSFTSSSTTIGINIYFLLCVSVAVHTAMIV